MPTNLRAHGLPPSAAHSRVLSVVGTRRPPLSWVVPLVRNGQAQSAYQIRASSHDRPHEDADLWDSGMIDSARNSGVAWGGIAIPPHTRVWWTVRTQDETGTTSEWAQPVPIDSAAYSLADWHAQWIGVAPTRRARIDVPAFPSVAAARISVAGWGPTRISVNGTVVNPDDLGPIDSSLQRATSRSYDVTDLVAQAHGPFELSIAASLGHYRLVLEQARVLAELRVTLADGQQRVIGTSGDWLSSPSGVTTDDPFYLEEHDPASPSRPGEHAPVVVVPPDASPPPPAIVVPNVGPPVRVVRVAKATLLAQPARGIRVFDLGENVAGRVALQLDGVRPGQRVTSTQGEKLTPDGRVDTTNIRLPADRERERQVFAVVCDAEHVEASPWFAVHGFRYVEVGGLDDDASVTVSARVLHSDVDRTGSVTTSVAELNQLVDYAVRTQLNNTHGLPEDCPTREQGGWTGDASVSAEAALSHLDMSGVYRNWLADVALDAGADGDIPGISPHLQGEHGRQPADPVWGSAMTEIPWQLWRDTGDTWQIEPLLPTMRRWADWQLTTLVDGVVRNAPISFGADWLALEQTPPVVLQTAAVVVSLRALADLEEAVGNADAAAARRAQADAVVAAARRALRDPVEGTWGTDSQGSSAVALVSGMADERDVDGLRARLRAAVHARGDRLSSGFAATRAVVRALADADGGSSLLAAVRQREQPGIGAMLVDGPGTFWETWWIDNENVGVASLDHIGLAAPFAAWVWRDVAGLRTLEPGFRRFALDPRLLNDVSSCEFTRDTARGRIAASWRLDDGVYRAELAVPVGSIAEVTCAGQGPVMVDGGRVATETDASGRRYVTVASGQHTVTVEHVAPRPAVEPRQPRPKRADVGDIWLSDGNTSRWIPRDSRLTVTVADTDVVCAPVFHEPIPAPTLDVGIPDFEANATQWLVLEHDGPLDLSRAAFAFASFDVDNPQIVGRAVRIAMRLTSETGEYREALARPLPIAWNRVAVDLEGWPGRSAVSEVAVGIRWSDEFDTALGPPLPLPPPPRPFSFRLGRIGWTSAPRTW
ncbi:family 78 glycoside hydrolase catalytic domain [Microbacterium sp. STN6]|uniref:family 78 glycoside hydrolase catalytic domain n=1 Tax=Microbacterium sp. STN6 TaxID=2995588 RepID=UPI00226090A3|nr:family 78 glycoside hydrolase catalytic domain [Microbacterium sp. STN6]MCX7522529.1 family 78 glycoside hydrolase catalytic domain [Microbacterium sp. STN6]